MGAGRETCPPGGGDWGLGIADCGLRIAEGGVGYEDVGGGSVSKMLALPFLGAELAGQTGVSASRGVVSGEGEGFLFEGVGMADWKVRWPLTGRETCPPGGENGA